MTRDQAILAVATAPGVPMACRVVLQGLLASAGEVPGGFVVGATQVEIGALMGVTARSVREQVKALEEAGVVVGRGRSTRLDASTLAIWLDGEAEPRSAKRNHDPQSGTTIRMEKRNHDPQSGTTIRKAEPQSGSGPSRTHTRDSLLGSDPKGSSPVRESEGVREPTRTHTHEGHPEPVIPIDPLAPPSLTPPVPAWDPDDSQVPSLVGGGGYASGYAVGSRSPQQAYTPAPAAVPMVPAGSMRRHFTPPPAGFPAVPLLTPEQGALLREVCSDLERALQKPTCPVAWESSARRAVQAFPEAAVRAGVVSVLDDIEAGRYARCKPEWVFDRAKRAAEAPSPQRGAYGQKRPARVRADAMPSREWWDDPANDPVGASTPLVSQSFDYGDEGSST